MIQYPKIQSLWKREPVKPCNIIPGMFTTDELAALADVPIWNLTEKVDGTNIRVGWYPAGSLAHKPPFQAMEGIQIRGRTDKAQTPDFLREKIEEMLPPDNFREAGFDLPVVLFGEGYGPKIQKGGGNYRDDPGFVLFDVYVPSPEGNGVWLSRENIEDVANKLKIDVVPTILDYATLEEMEALVKQGLISRWGDFEAEGLVARTEPEFRDRRGHRIITKLKTKDYRQLEGK